MRKKMKSTWMSSRKSNSKRKSNHRWTMMIKMMSTPTAMTNLRKAQDRRSVLKEAYQAVGLVKKPMTAKKLTCLMIWKTTMRTSMRMK